MSDDQNINELRNRVIYALFSPAAKISQSFKIPLSNLKELMEVAYFHETKKSGLKMKEVAKVMDVSMSKVALLSRALKKNFSTENVDLARRIEFMLWSGAMTSAKIKQVLPDASAEEINSTLLELVQEKKLRKERRDQVFHYVLNIDVDRRVWDSWLAKVDGLNNVLRTVADAVYARFFENDERAFARTLSFRVMPADIEKLRAFYEKELFKLIVELDAKTEGEEDAIPLSLSLFWAPYNFIEEKDKEEK